MKLASKSKNRIELLEAIQEGITSHEIFETIDYKNQSEDKIKQFIYPILINQLTDWIVEKKGLDSDLARAKAKSILKWEGNVKTTVHNIQFAGTSNRPDMTLEYDGLNVAIEFKKGDRGSALREGFGQGLIYATVFDFVIYLFIDTSAEGKIRNGCTAIAEQDFFNSLWTNFNIKFIAI